MKPYKLLNAIQEAIDCLEYLIEDGCTDTQQDYIEEIQMAIGALKKSKPMQIEEIHIDEYCCPACGAENNCDQGIVGDSFCPQCGQSLYFDGTLESR